MDIPIACRLDPDALAGRREEWAAIRPARTGQRRTATTLTTTWRLDSGIRAELERLVSAERECCPFLGLELTFGDGSVTLVTSFPEGLSPDDWEW
ncbi:MAG TPA: hypothetical protein VLB81_10285 [Gaiellales bacterium]|nr:hypothetical protein [Gaiellales bacterium]